MRTAPLAPLFTLGLAACQPSVEGWWEGEIGDTACTLRVEQTGSSLTGEICAANACEPLRGTAEEDRAEVSFGCATCNFPRTRLELQVGDGTLEGQAYLVDCDCAPGDASCTCRAHAYFDACDGAC